MSTPEERLIYWQKHPRRNELLRSLGTSADVEVDVDPVDAAPGDVFLLCSDGLHGVVEDDKIAELLRAETAAEAAHALIDAANLAGGPDNVTVQVIRIPPPRGGAMRVVGAALALVAGVMVLWRFAASG